MKVIDFNKDTNEYSIEVPNGTEKVNIKTSLEDTKAKVSGDGEVSVSEGTNKLEVKVTAENGNERVYIINVTVKELDPIEVTVDKKNNLSYIKVSIAEQKLYYYERNKLMLETNIVTGMRGVSPTPTGDYKVLSKARNVNLTGDDYTSFVSYWIAFKGNSYGLHDASWRSRFGGNIYTYNGSHGCVNMPRSEVSKLYNMVEIGTPVYVH